MNLRVKVTLNNGGIPQYSKSEMCFAKADLFGERGITPSPEDKVTMLEKGKSLKEIVMERIENDMIDPTEIVKDSIRPYADVKKLFAKTFLSNPKISMHVSAAWMSDEESVKPKVVPAKEETHENTEVEDEYELDSSDASVPTFAESNDMDDFMAELEAEQMGM